MSGSNSNIAIDVMMVVDDLQAMHQQWFHHGDGVLVLCVLSVSKSCCNRKQSTRHGRIYVRRPFITNVAQTAPKPFYLTKPNLSIRFDASIRSRREQLAETMTEELQKKNTLVMMMMMMMMITIVIKPN
jgi:hypothetical protein